MPKKKSFKTPQQIWEAVSSKSVHFVEDIFFRLGVCVARNPWKTIVLTLLFVSVSCVGLLKFHIEKNPLKLWVPPESDYYFDTNWYIDKFGTGFRFQNVLIVADNVLEPEVLKKIYDLTSEINAIHITHAKETFSISNLCYKVPVVNFFSSKSESLQENSTSYKDNKDNDDDFSDLTLFVDEDFYCSFLEGFELTCLENNILNIWKNDINKLNKVTKNEIVSKVNTIKTNPVTGHPVDYSKFLGGIKYDDNKNIVSANTVLLTWYTQVNMSAVNLDEVGNLVGTEDWVSVPLAIWETKFLERMKSMSQNATGIQIFYEAGRSFGDISRQSMFYDMDKLTIGIVLMFFYIQFGLSRCNWLEIRLTLGSVGLLCVGLSYVSAVSWCSVLGISFGPVHSSLPFLLMGLGIDDMFVMNACWKNLSEAELKKSLPVKIGLMLKHAGVSIVITSFTDIVALLIGAITVLPSLKSFCVYAAVGVFFIFCYSVTFYVAVLTLDIKRIEANRNGVLFCYQHKNSVQISTDKTMLQKLFESFYKNIVFTIPGKSIVILITFIITGFSIQSVLRLEQRFDPKWFIPDDTYYKQYLDAYDYYYPGEGHTAMVFLGELNYKNDFANLYNMLQQLDNEPYVNELVSWIDYFYRYVLKNYNRDLRNSSTVSEEEFNKYLSRFLSSPVGGRFQLNFKFPEPFHCGVPITHIVATTLQFKFSKFFGPEEYLPAMNRVKNIVRSTNLTSNDGYLSVWSKVFGNWVTDEIISVEVERNIELALLCVMACTVILITNLQMCFWIFLCVTLTIL